MHALLEEFFADCQSTIREFAQPADIALELAPMLQSLLGDYSEFMSEQHFASCSEHYARNLIYASADGRLSLYSLVWSPGQWTPVHDHGTWGLVGVVKGILEERNFIRTDTREREDSGIILRRGGHTLLGPGSVTTFVPNPDHIHRTGVPKSREVAVSLHLYGRNMNHYNVYDLELGRRYPIELDEDSLKNASGEHHPTSSHSKRP
jgi:3-mercaptopropionate dioxygenase